MNPAGASENGQSLERLVMSRRVLVAVGAGGVGKTTIAAALSMAAALRGRRVLCLTIDPARRLGEALGLDAMSSEGQVVDPARFAGSSRPVAGSLTAMMLDTKRTFDALVGKYASSPEQARRLLDNKLYRYVSTSLAGTQEYMAMEKLVELQRDARFDLIVLDTPPTANALDFLDAPDRMIEALDSSTIRFFLQAVQSTGTLSLNVLARSATLVMRGLGRITGAGFLEAMAQFLAELNGLFGGFKERAGAVKAALRSAEVSFVLVTSPAPMSIREVLFFSDRLERAAMPRGAFVVNRMRSPPAFADVIPSGDEAARAAAERGLRLGASVGARLVAAHADATGFAALDQRHLRELTGRAIPVIRLPELTGDIRDLGALANIAELLMAGGV
jgi:anion-transporting  ArsA/GET3 family ATPase